MAAHWPKLISYSLLLLLGTMILGYYCQQADFNIICLGFGLMSFGYLAFLNVKNRSTPLFYFGLALAIICRILLLPSFPSLSDDIYRFIWDGKLLLEGIPPFLYKPSELIEGELYGHLQLDTIFPRLNSPEYYSVYPPFSQWVFYASVRVCDIVPQHNAIFIRLCIIACELFNMYIILRLLQKLNIDRWRLFLYALNPLVIIEFTGNLHFEVFTIAFLLFSILLLHKNVIGSGVAFALSIASKLIPLIFGFLFIKSLGWKKSMLFILSLGLCTAMIWYPYFDLALIQNMGASVNLYFQTFEFNASLYYLLRYLGYLTKGYNLISLLGPLLGMLVLVFALGQYFSTKLLKLSDMFQAMTILLAVYYFCATTVHPWYIGNLIALSVFCKWRFPIIWSLIIPLTYINYSYDPYFENLWIVAIEYILVLGFLGVEFRKENSPFMI